jgi:hypothetical protein
VATTVVVKTVQCSISVVRIADDLQWLLFSCVYTQSHLQSAHPHKDLISSATQTSVYCYGGGGGKNKEWPPNKGQLCPRHTKFIVANQTTNVTRNRLYLHDMTLFLVKPRYKQNTLLFPAPFNISWYNEREGSTIQRGSSTYLAAKTHWDTSHMATTLTMKCVYSLFPVTRKLIIIKQT